MYSEGTGANYGQILCILEVHGKQPQKKVLVLSTLYSDGKKTEK